MCSNASPHLRGNVYVQFLSEEDAERARALFNGRWYAGRQLTCYLVTIEKWKSALCGKQNKVSLIWCLVGYWVILSFVSQFVEPKQQDDVDVWYIAWVYRLYTNTCSSQGYTGANSVLKVAIAISCMHTEILVMLSGRQTRTCNLLQVPAKQRITGKEAFYKLSFSSSYYIVFNLEK